MTNYYKIRATTGNVTVGESEMLFLPSKPRPAGKFGVILLHGSGADYAMFADSPHWASTQIPAFLARAGIPSLSIQMGGNTYANDTAMTAITAAIAYLASAAGVPSTKVCLLGISMGGGTAMRYASLNPSKVAAVAGLIPQSNIIRNYEENTIGLRAGIGTAWGVTYPTPLPSGADLVALAPAMNGVVPSTLWYDDADTVILPADVIALGTAAGSTLVEVPPDLGHTESTTKAIVDLGAGSASEIINFFMANGA